MLISQIDSKNKFYGSQLDESEQVQSINMFPIGAHLVLSVLRLSTALKLTG